MCWIKMQQKPPVSFLCIGKVLQMGGYNIIQKYIYIYPEYRMTPLLLSQESDRISIVQILPSLKRKHFPRPVLEFKVSV